MSPSRATSTTQPVPTATLQPTPTAAAPWIAYQGPEGLSLVRLDGSDGHLFAGSARARARHPDWSPDGEWLAYRVDGPGGATAIWISRIDGRNAREIVPCQKPCEFVDDPAWSPDGLQLAYWDTRADGPQAIRVIEVASGEVSATIPGGPREGPIRPRWSPDGARLVIETEIYDEDGELLKTTLGVIDLEAEVPIVKPVTPPDLLAGYPDWDASTDSILFQSGNVDPFSRAGEPPQLFVIRPDGDGLQQLTDRQPTEPFIALPAWADGGQLIVATLIHSQEMFTLAALPADGGAAVELVDGDGEPIIGAHTRIARQ